MMPTSERRQIEDLVATTSYVEFRRELVPECIPTLMMTIDSRVDRKARPTRYLAGPVLLNQARWSFDCDLLDVTGLARI